jgi:diguanylate cyclase (GGDEF)-like protein
MVIRKIIARTLAMLLFLCCGLRAQEYSFRNYGSADGLNDLSVRAIFQDRVGFLWVATLNGFFRYDGERFEAFGKPQGVPSSPNTAFGDAPDGSLLAGGAFGLIRLRGNRFEKVPGAFKNVGEIQGIQSDGKGHTYVNTNRGLMELSIAPGKNEIAIHPIPLPPGTVETESNGVPEVGGVLVDGDAVWYACGAQLCRLEKNGTRVYGIKDGLPAQTVVSLLKDHQGTLWLRLRNVGVFVLPVGESRFRRPQLLDRNDSLAGIPAVDANGQVILPLPDGMLIERDGNWQKIDHTSGLRGAVFTALEDRQHSLWIGMKGRGLEQWRGYREWENYTTNSGLASDEVHGIVPEENGPIWVGTDAGLLRGERKSTGVEWKRIAGLDGAVTVVRKGPDGALWMGAGSFGVTRLDPGTGKLTLLKETQGANKGVFQLYFDHQQQMWVGTNIGLYMAKAPYKTFVHVSELPSSRIWAITEGADGTLWVGGVAGLSSFKDGHWTSYPESDPTKRQVLTLGVGANGTMWVAYRLNNEIDRVHLGPRGLETEKNLQRPGSNEIVYFMESDKQGRMWAGTDHGVEVWNGMRWSRYEMSDGLVWNKCNQNAFAAEPDGTVWIGTSGGLSRFKPRPQSNVNGTMGVVFTELEMSGADVSGLNNPSFEMHTNSLLARYSALNAPRENAVIFRYRLGGANSSWTETTQRELRFARLAPGEYRLQIEAQNGDGVWRAHPAEFAFRILSPWYRTWWFFTLCGLLPLCGTGVFYKTRMAAAATREHNLQLLVEAQKTIQNLAFYDPLTELPNRRMLLDCLRKALASSARTGRLGALLFVDLDKFKPLNDSFGHKAGDLLLQETARRLTGAMRQTDTIARLGGDEFVAILEDLSALAEEAASQAKTVAMKVLAVTSNPYMLAGHECIMSSSVGIAIFGDQQADTEEVLQQADIAMYQAKAAGGNAVRFFAPELQVAINTRTAMEEELREAVKQAQFRLFYQPQVERGVVVGAEALLRWKHPQRGILPPGNFIPLAEETGLILPLGDWVLETACQQLTRWAADKETAHLSIAVNISARQIRQPGFVEKVLAILAQTGANPRNLELELTESMLVKNIDDVVGKMAALKAHGLRFSLDDFGTGYSSLSYLGRLPLDRLKIDRAFVRDILADDRGGAIAMTIISLGKALGLSVMAEGVENEDQLRYLDAFDCHLYQGYFFSWPLPINDFEKLLASQNGASHRELESFAR